MKFQACRFGFFIFLFLGKDSTRVLSNDKIIHLVDKLEVEFPFH